MMKRAVVVVLVTGTASCGGGSGGAGDASVDALRFDGRVDATADARFDSDPRVEITFTIELPTMYDAVLYSDNDGPWQPMAGTAGLYRALVYGPRYAIARGCGPGLEYNIARISYLTTEDAVALTDPGCPVPGTVTLSGTLTGVGPDLSGNLFANGDNTYLSPGAASYALTLAPGTTDLIGHLAAASTQPRPAQRMYIARDIEVPTDTVHDVDFATDGFDPVEHLIAVEGAGGTTRESVRVYVRTDNTFGLVENTFQATDRYHAPPASRLVAGDSLMVRRTSQTGGSLRSVSVYTSTPGDLTAAYAPPYDTLPPTVVATTPFVRLAGMLPFQADTDQFEVLVLTAASGDVWSQVYSARWVGGQAIEYSVPDLAGIPGWSLGIGTGTIFWYHTARNSLLTTLPPNAGPVDGNSITSSETSGTLDVP